MLEDVDLELSPIRFERIFSQGRRSGNQFTGDHALASAFAHPVLHTQHLAPIPAQRHHADDAAVAVDVAVEITGALPNADGRQMGRLHGRHLPLVHRVVRDAAQAHLAVAPGLLPCPFDALVEILGFLRRPNIHPARRAPGAA
jgi:hypothetical protein